MTKNDGSAMNVKEAITVQYGVGFLFFPHLSCCVLCGKTWLMLEDRVNWILNSDTKEKWSSTGERENILWKYRWNVKHVKLAVIEGSKTEE